MINNEDLEGMSCLNMAVLFTVGVAMWLAVVAFGMWLIR